MLTRTTTQLLDSLRDPSNQALWREFDERFRPVVTAFARRRGLGPEEAADAAQATLADFADGYRTGRYDRTKGRLRTWILGIAQHRIAAAWRERARHAAVRGDSALADLPDPATAPGDWDEAAQAVVLERALRALHTETRMDARTLRAFELSALRGVPAEGVAAECGMTVAEVYVAKNRAIARLREIVARLSRELEDE
jgi:RNA polymerase sigma factor (sigma-70 family)